MKTYFIGESCARGPVTITAGLVLTTIGICSAVMWILQLSSIARWGQAMGMICALLFILVWLGGGIFLLRQVVKNKKTKLSITSEGVSYGGLRYGWHDIAEIGVMQNTRRKDLYCIPRLQPYSFRMDLIVSGGLSSEQVGALFEALRSEVIPLHPHVRLLWLEGKQLCVLQPISDEQNC